MHSSRSNKCRDYPEYPVRGNGSGTRSTPGVSLARARGNSKVSLD